MTTSWIVFTYDHFAPSWACWIAILDHRKVKEQNKLKAIKNEAGVNGIVHSYTMTPNHKIPSRSLTASLPPEKFTGP